MWLTAVGMIQSMSVSGTKELIPCLPLLLLRLLLFFYNQNVNLLANQVIPGQKAKVINVKELWAASLFWFQVERHQINYLSLTWVQVMWLESTCLPCICLTQPCQHMSVVSSREWKTTGLIPASSFSNIYSVLWCWSKKWVDQSGICYSVSATWQSLFWVHEILIVSLVQPVPQQENSWIGHLCKQTYEDP